MRWIDSLSLKGKRVLVRADFNVPLKENGDIADDFRIISTVPTLRYVLEQGGKLILMSHLGDPEGKRVEKLSMDKVQEKLTEYLGVSVDKASDCTGKELEERTKNMQKGEVLLLENLRFKKQEQANDRTFAENLARLGDVYILEAFGVAHREHASVVGVPRFLPSAGGFLLRKEIEALSKLLENPVHPMIALVGGRKIESKLPLIAKIATLADEVLLGNLLANEIQEKNVNLGNAGRVVLPSDGVPDGKRAFDIGPETRKLYGEKVKAAKTVFWSGPMGKYEEKEYVEGSKHIAMSIDKNTSYAVAGGGNLLDFLGRHGLRDRFDHISTGGSSMLAFLAGEELPGLEALKGNGD